MYIVSKESVTASEVKQLCNKAQQSTPFVFSFSKGGREDSLSVTVSGILGHPIEVHNTIAVFPYHLITAHFRASVLYLLDFSGQQKHLFNNKPLIMVVSNKMDVVKMGCQF